MINTVFNTFNSYLPPHFYSKAAFLYLEVDLFYMSTAFLTSIPPNHGLVFVSILMTVDQLAKLTFRQMEFYPQFTFPFKCVQISSDLLITKLICRQLSIALKIKQACLLIFLFLFSSYLTEKIFNQAARDFK